MNTPENTYQLLVALCGLNDGNLFEPVSSQYPNEYAPSVVRLFGGLAKDIQALIDDYDFIESEAFLATIQGKSPAFANMKRKFASDPVHRKARKQEFIDALKRLPHSRDAFHLLSIDHHSTLERILAAIASANKDFRE